MLNKLIIIFNPTAGKGLAKKQLPLIEAYLEKSDVNFELINTEYIGHAAEIAETYANTEDIAVIAAGGDGTCNEVINGLMKGKKQYSPVFSVIPIGRGNDFSYGANVPNKIEEALDVIINGKTSFLDIGLIKGGDYPDGRYFGNGIGIGFDTTVGLEASKMKYLKGALGYIAGTVKTLIKFSDSPVIETTFNDNNITLKAIQISIMNGSRMGGLFYMAPDAVNNDGQLDLCIVKHINRRTLLTSVKHYTKGTQKGTEGIIMDRAKSYNIKALNGNLIVHADGETICTTGKELKIDCIPEALRIIHN
ncbi:MAG: diacylglycerol kinase family lipid kinase [Spirochaetaceae bacterium]